MTRVHVLDEHVACARRRALELRTEHAEVRVGRSVDLSAVHLTPPRRVHGRRDVQEGRGAELRVSERRAHHGGCHAVLTRSIAGRDLTESTHRSGVAVGCRGDVGGRRVGRGEGGVDGRVVVDAAVEDHRAVLRGGPVGRGGVGAGPDVLPVSTGGGSGGAAVRERGERREQEGTQRRDHGLARAHRGTSIGEGSAWPF